MLTQRFEFGEGSNFAVGRMRFTLRRTRCECKRKRVKTPSAEPGSRLGRGFGRPIPDQAAWEPPFFLASANELLFRGEVSVATESRAPFHPVAGENPAAHPQRGIGDGELSPGRRRLILVAR